MRRHFLRGSTLYLGALLALAVAVPSRAQDADDLKRGVARISVINGDVNVRRGDSGEWVAGVINAPLLTDDRIATGPSSRTEVQFDASNMFRMGANAELHLAQLEYGRYQLELARGLSTFRMLRQNDTNIEIDTPSLSIRPSRQGSVRILVNDAGETEVTAHGGDVEVFTPRGSQWIRNGQMMLARGTASDPEFQIVQAGALDDWDRWSDSRDRVLTQSVSSRYVGPGVYGSEDLDNYGTWESVPEYGYVWHPTVAADWTPYYYGRWSWADWYGWTWVSYDPWGWAPYHYGRWFHHDHYGWCWYPGVVTARHYWSPALVAFIGFGGGGGVGFGFGNVGWVPLAPYEVYHPWWGRAWYGSGGYFNHQVNVVNVNVYNSYRNARYNGVSAVGYRDFSDGRFNHVSRVNASQIRDAGAIRGATPFSPGSQHLRYSDRAVNNVPRVNENARFFRSQTPNPVQRVPFAQSGRASDGRFGAGNSPASVNASPAQAQNGWRRFGQTPATSGVAPSNNGRVERGGFGGGSPAQPQDRRATPSESPRQDNRGSGWQRFGNPGSSGNQPGAQSAPRQEYRDGGSSQRFGGSSDSGRSFGSRTGGESQPQVRQQPQSRQDFSSQPRSFGGNSRQESIRVAPPVVRERPMQSTPRQSAPSYSPPARQSSPGFGGGRQSAPSYSAPRQAPSGGGGSTPHGNSGGGGHSSGGGGNHRGR